MYTTHDRRRRAIRIALALAVAVQAQAAVRRWSATDGAWENPANRSPSACRVEACFASRHLATPRSP
jgi:hypothetical protein